MEKKSKTNLREIRSLPTKFEIRESGEENATRTINGAIKYDTESQTMRDWWGDQFVEVLAEGVFDESLKTRDVVGLWSHNTAQVLGNTKSETLRLSNDKKELRFDLDIPSTTVGNDAWELIKRGDVDGISFGMKVTKDKWSSEDRESGKLYKRTILEAELYEISPVAFPAYPANEVSVRSLEDYKNELSCRVAEQRKRILNLELELIK